MDLILVVQELYDFSRKILQQKVSQRFLVNRGVLYDILKVQSLENSGTLSK